MGGNLLFGWIGKHVQLKFITCKAYTLISLENRYIFFLNIQKSHNSQLSQEHEFRRIFLVIIKLMMFGFLETFGEYCSVCNYAVKPNGFFLFIFAFLHLINYASLDKQVNKLTPLSTHNPTHAFSLSSRRVPVGLLTERHFIGITLHYKKHILKNDNGRI